MNKIKALIADDHTIFRESLKTLLEGNPLFNVVALANDGKEAIEKTKATLPDVALIDISMPGIDGLSAIKEILRECPHTKILVLSMHEDEELVYQALDSGALGYVSKGISAKDLFSAIQAVCRGRCFLDPSVSGEVIGIYLDTRRKEKGEILTPRERQVLKLLVEGNSKKEIAKLLFISPHTVDTHRTNILQKLNLKTMVDLVKYAIKKKIITT